MHVYAKENAYQESLGTLFDATPKAVFAALAVSFIHRLGTGDDESDSTTPGAVQVALLTEWQILHDNGIVPQRPPRRGP